MYPSLKLKLQAVSQQKHLAQIIKWQEITQDHLQTKCTTDNSLVYTVHIIMCITK